MENNPKKPLGRVYAGINIEGNNAIKNKDVPEFTGFPDDFERRFNFWVEFSEETKFEIHERILKELEKIEEETGIKLYLAGRDFTLHSSILQGKNDEGVNIDEKYNKLLNDNNLKDLGNLLNGINIEFKYLLFDKKGTIILVSTEIPSEIPEARKKINKAYEENDVEGLDIDILHTTIGRIGQIPEGDRKDLSLEKFKDLFRVLRTQISSNPINVNISSINLAQGGVAKGGKSEEIK